MAKQQRGGGILHLLAWITGVVVSLVVGNGMIQKTLVLPSWLGGQVEWIAVSIGWIVVVSTLVGAGMAILKK